MTGSPPTALRPQHPNPRSLRGLADEFGFDVRGPIGDLEVTGVGLSSSSVRPGDLYVGVQGRNTHGAQFAAAARDAGAVALLTDEAGAALAAEVGLPVLVTPDARAALGEVAAWIHRTAENPATFFAVTGTNGKTSVVYLLYGILRQLGVVAGLTSTAERRIGDEAVTSSLTTPEASELHALLARMREVDVRAVGIEVSAQALSRHRVDGLVFDIAGFTNLSHDHLDDYATLEEYFEAKLELFQPARARRGVVTVDSAWGARLALEANIPVTTLTTRDDIAADWRLTVLDEEATYTSFVLEGAGGRRLESRVPLLGWYMAANAALAIVMLVDAGYDLDRIAEALERDGGVDAYIPGRAERISGDRGPIVYIDYGHSPDAFLQTLAAIRRFTSGRVIMVFGADGDRDVTKRAEMGAIAARGADVVVVTDFHPRFEDPAAIRATLIEGARAAVSDREIHEIADPRTAFRTALAIAEEGDAILYAGPGHEDYHEVRGVKLPYSAREDSKQALREAGVARVIALTLAEIASATGGDLHLGGSDASPQTIVSGAVTTDSREVTGGDVFVAKRGEFDDGHRFAPAAVEQGAALLIVEHPLELAVPQVVVADSVDGLGLFAAEVVRRVRALGRLRIVGVTGSNGKTTTKNLLRTVLERVGPTVAARASFNNEVGAPITMLELTDETEFLVAEMGASGVGEIARLIRMARPDVGIVLKVGLAHAGEFGGIERTVLAKSEMVTDLHETDVAVLNADDARVVPMAGLTAARVLWFGLGESADVRATDVRAHARGTDFTVTIPGGESAEVHFGVLGEHHVMNALAAIAASVALDVPLAGIVDALEQVTLAERWRMQVMGGRDGITVINDAYNASPDSMAAALKTLAQVKAPGARTIAVLGEMSELGEFSGEEHDRIGLLAVRLGISQLVVVGEGARRLHITAINEGSWDGESAYVESEDEAFDLVVSTVRAGDTVLVKSSNAAGLRILGDRLGEWFA